MNKKEYEKTIRYVFRTAKDLALSDLDSEHLDKTDLNSELHDTLQYVLESLDEERE